MYAVIDIETTGMSPERDRITEVAVVLSDGQKITESFSTLIDPERPIPPHITTITGIDDAMVADAPPFYEVARRIVEMTEGRVFVAHNARFDYSFLRAEFARLGYRYRRDLLDTVRESRRLLPGLSSYSLGVLCEAVGIVIEERHRALGDARATAELLHLLLRKKKEAGVEPPTLSSALQEKIREIPAEPGVYYLHDHRGEVIYIGKSRNLRHRVQAHLSGGNTRRALRIRQETTDITWQVTGSELIALLLEAAEIRQHLPRHNRAQRRRSRRIGLFSFTDPQGYIRFELRQAGEEEIPLQSFGTLAEGREKLSRLVEQYDLCQKLAGLYDGTGTCFHYKIGMCRGACAGEENAAAYNLRARRALQAFDFDQQNFFILDRGRHPQERAVIKVEHGLPAGYGYVDINQHFFGTEPLHDCIRPLPHYREMKTLVVNYLRKHRVEQIFPF